MIRENKERGEDIDIDIIKQAYHWLVDVNGQLWGLVAGDHGYEETGIYLDGPVIDLSIYDELRVASNKIINLPQDHPEYNRALEVIRSHNDGR